MRGMPSRPTSGQLVLRLEIHIGRIAVFPDAGIPAHYAHCIRHLLKNTNEQAAVTRGDVTSWTKIHWNRLTSVIQRKRFVVLR